MSRRLTCLACGLESWDSDVAMTLVEVDEREARVVSQPLVTALDGHGRPAGMEYRDVRELYISEPRCRDRRACHDRVAALEPAVESVSDEELAWLG